MTQGELGFLLGFLGGVVILIAIGAWRLTAFRRTRQTTGPEGYLALMFGGLLLLAFSCDVAFCHGPNSWHIPQSRMAE